MKEAARSDSEPSSSLAWDKANIGARAAPRSTLWSWLRLKPSFLIIGAQKAGTTSLYSYLVQHPDILRSTRKEVHYFDTADYEQGDAWYRSHFPGPPSFMRLSSGSGRQQPITGEASPYYLAHPATPARVKAFAPDLKLIVMLRDPISRAFSHYNHQVRQGRETLSFEDALNAEAERLGDEHEKMLADPTYYSYNHWLYSYVDRGRYADQLEHWFKFFPRKQFLFIDSSDFFANPRNAYNEAVSFLDMRPAELESAPKKNAGQYDGMSESAKNFLQETFVSPNQKLEGLLGRTFSWSHS